MGTNSFITVQEFLDNKVNNMSNVKVLGKLLHSSIEKISKGYCGYLSNSRDMSDKFKMRFYIGDKKQDLLRTFEKIQENKVDEFYYFIGQKSIYEKKNEPQLVNITSIDKVNINQDIELSKDIKRIGFIGSNASKAKDDFLLILKEYGINEKFDYLQKFVKLDNPFQITTAIKEFSDSKDVDVICIMRGGGDGLECFDNSMIIKEILNAKEKGKYVITGLGHANDFTLSDIYANLAANTPTDVAYKFVMYSKDKEKENHIQSLKRQRNFLFFVTFILVCYVVYTYLNVK